MKFSNLITIILFTALVVVHLNRQHNHYWILNPMLKFINNFWQMQNLLS